MLLIDYCKHLLQIFNQNFTIFNLIGSIYFLHIPSQTFHCKLRNLRNQISAISQQTLQLKKLLVYNQFHEVQVSPLTVKVTKNLANPIVLQFRPMMQEFHLFIKNVNSLNICFFIQLKDRWDEINSLQRGFFRLQVLHEVL